MSNLKLINVNVKSSQDIILEFSDNLNSGVNVSNITITSKNTSVPNSEVLSVKLKNNFIIVKCKPLTPFITYDVKATSNSSYTFAYKNNVLFQDNISNVFEIIGPIEKENIFKQSINSSLSGGVYGLEEGTNTATIINSLSKQLDSALDSIKDLKNENYISFDVIDELKVRGSGPFDKLNEGSAYEVIRVAQRPTNTFSTDTYTFDSTDYTLVSLQETYNSEILLSNSSDSKGYFNIINFNLNLKKSNVIKVKSITFTLSTENPLYEYDIEKYGYQLLDPRYDKFASKYFDIESNQVKLNESILDDSDFDIAQIVKIDVEYYYKDTGKLIYNPEIFSRKSITREVISPLVSNFFLKNSKIIDENNEICTLNGLDLINLNGLSNHPAFLHEIEFKYEQLPYYPGQYSVNYENGNVYVYGESSSNLGTGSTPPVISYTYKELFDNEIDYVYDSDTYDLAILPKGKATDKTLYVSYTYENVYVNNLDYKASLHEESLNERIDNRLSALNLLTTKNYPITNVFRIYNETSGEIYPVSRFDGNKIYFKYVTPPNIKKTSELVDFHSFNEKITPILYTTNSSDLIIAKIQLSNTNIISNSNDLIASFVNTSLILDKNIFITEKYFSSIDNILDVGEYLVDYSLGIIYVGVESTTISDFGEANYKYNNINPQFSHVLYLNSLGYVQPSTESIEIRSSTIEDDSVEISSLANSFEDSVNDSPYILLNSEIGYIDSYSFVNKTKNEISMLNGLYEYEDFINSSNPLNFAQYCSYENKNISYNDYEETFFDLVKSSIDGYYIEIPKQVYYSSSNLTYTYTARSVLTNNLIDVLSFDTDSNTNIIFLDTNTIENVSFTLNISINNLSKLIIDYSRGSIIMDYNYLADEIVVNYEYGLNSLDFREGTIDTDKEYYVSYKVGALRDALIRNFATLINIDELSNIDPSFNRERYRDALYAAMSSFILGPTLPALKNIVKQITHVEPEIKESAFNTWSLGDSLLYNKDISSSGTFSLLPAKHGDGVLCDNGSISIPTFNNLNIEDGTLSFWTIPQWNGIDNLKDISVNILEDGLDISSDKIFIGANEEHPDSNEFVLSSSIIKGKPNTNKDGIYFYIDKDDSNLFDRWYVAIVDGYSTPTNTFKITLESEFYDFKVLDGYSSTSTNSKIVINTGSSYKSELYSFIADSNKYFVDIKNEKSRFSLYKDNSGYLCFEIIDKNNKKYKISSNVSDWISGEAHQISASWKIGSKSKEDEMHLFIDGTEVSNSLTYTSNIRSYIHQNFRTVAKETFVGISGKDIVGSSDLETTSGSTTVSSLINFSAYNISAGDYIYIDNDNFDTYYEIVSVSGQDLELDTAMPISLSNLNFSINKTNFDGYGRYYLNSNNYFYKLSYFSSGNDLSSTTDSNIVTVSSISSDIIVGDLLRINSVEYDNYYTITSIDGYSIYLDSDMPATNSGLEYFIYHTDEIELKSPRARQPDYSLDKYTISVLNNLNSNELLFATSLGLNFEVVKSKYYNWADGLTSILKTQLPRPTSIEDVDIYKYLINNVIINSSNSTIDVSNNFESEILSDNPINSQSGRQLTVSIIGSNIDFSNPVTIEVFGNVNYINTSEVLIFNDYGEINTTNLFFTVSKVKVNGTVLNENRSYLSITCKELESIFNPQVSYYSPELKYSYIVNSGSTLEKYSDNVVIDNSNVFSISNVNDYLVINEPIEVAGFYKIIGVDSNKLELEELSTAFVLPLSDFSEGTYNIYKSVSNATGIQNGFFNFEPLDFPGQQYMLTKGYYEFVYPTYLNIKFDLGDSLFIGSDYESNNHANSIINEFVIYNTALTDVRTGEDSLNESITKNYNSIKGSKVTKNVLFLCKFNEYPFVNEANYYAALKDNNIIYANNSVNSNFGSSVYLNNKNIILDNNGYLDFKNEGCIEFWVSPIYDTLYDYNDAYYFDASSYVKENIISSTKNTIYLKNKAESIISVKINGSDVNYYSGGFINIERKESVNEVVTSDSANKITLSQEASEVLYVKINNYLNTDYFDGGSIASNNRTIYLNKSLPNNNVEVIVSYKTKNNNYYTNQQVIVLGSSLPSNNTNVEVIYVPKGTNGDRISIFKDRNSYLNFNIYASGNNFNIKAPIVWERNSWHRIKANYKINSTKEGMSLFIDGYKYNSINDTTVIGDGYLDGYSTLYSINIADTINYIAIGSTCTSSNYGNIFVDNFRLSNKYRDTFKYLGESLDINYLINESLPVVQDLYTTYLLDSDIEYNLFEDFSILINKNSGIFEFVINIFDSFNILEDNPYSKTILEKLLNVLKPANSRIFLNYI